VLLHYPFLSSFIDGLAKGGTEGPRHIFILQPQTYPPIHPYIHTYIALPAWFGSASAESLASIPISTLCIVPSNPCCPAYTYLHTHVSHTVPAQSCTSTCRVQSYSLALLSRELSSSPLLCVCVCVCYAMIYAILCCALLSYALLCSAMPRDATLKDSGYIEYINNPAAAGCVCVKRKVTSQRLRVCRVDRPDGWDKHSGWMDGWINAALKRQIQVFFSSLGVCTRMARWGVEVQGC